MLKIGESVINMITFLLIILYIIISVMLSMFCSCINENADKTYIIFSSLMWPILFPIAVAYILLYLLFIIPMNWIKQSKYQPIIKNKFKWLA